MYEHVLSSLIRNLIQKLHKHHISLRCKMNACVFWRKESSICVFDISQKDLKNRAESRPNDLINFMKISIQNIDLPHFHQLLEFICDKGYEEERDAVKALIALLL